MTYGQTPFWKDLSGSPNYSLLGEGANGVLFATYGVFNTFGTSEDGLYRSTNGGLSWSRTVITGQIEEMETNGKYILTTRIPSFEYVRNYSTDNGATWSALVATRSFFLYYVTLNNSGGVYALNLANPIQVIMYDFVFRRWRAIGNQLPLASLEGPSAFRIDNQNNFYVGTDKNGLYISKDTGKTWSNVLPNRNVSHVFISSSNNIYVGTALKDTNRGGVYFSGDTGRTWKLLGLTQRQINSLETNSNEKIYAMTERGIYTYSDSGTVWNLLGPKSAMFEDMLVTESNSIVTTSSSEGLYRSTNFGTTWSKTITVRDENIAKICFDNSNKIYLGTWGNRIYTSIYNEIGWSQSPDGTIGDEVHAFTNKDSLLFAATDRGLYRTSNHGVNWSNVTEATFGGNAYSIANAQSGELYIGTNWGVYRSTNNGDEWESLGLSSFVISSLAINPNNDLFAGTETGNLFRSTDGGMNWTNSNFTGETITCLTISGDGDIIAGSYGGVYRSTDNGESWNFIQFISTYVNALLPKGQNYLYAGTFSGVYSSSNNGESWTQMSTSGLRQTTILSLAFDKNNNLIAGTYQGGLYRTEQSITDVENENEIPTSTILFQNYPNPFNPSTTLSFVICQSSLVSLKIYNLLGQEIVKLMNEESFNAGEHSVVWNADGNPSGVYISRLEITTNSNGIQHKSIQTKKIVLVR